MTNNLPANDPMLVIHHRDFLSRVQGSLRERAERYRKKAAENGSPALSERAAIYDEISDIIGTWKP